MKFFEGLINGCLVVLPFWCIVIGWLVWRFR
jgi:hypothetical protein